MDVISGVSGELWKVSGIVKGIRTTFEPPDNADCRVIFGEGMMAGPQGRKEGG